MTSTTINYKAGAISFLRVNSARRWNIFLNPFQIILLQTESIILIKADEDDLKIE